MTSKIKLNDYREMSNDERREWKENQGFGHIRGMWEHSLDCGEFSDDETLLITDDGYVIYKTGRKINGVQMTDETCAYYERCRNGYYRDEDSNNAGRSAVRVYEYHYGF